MVSNMQGKKAQQGSLLAGLGVYSWLRAQGSLLAGLRGSIGCLGWNPGEICARQVALLAGEVLLNLRETKGGASWRWAGVEETGGNIGWK